MNTHILYFLAACLFGTTITTAAIRFLLVTRLWHSLDFDQPWEKWAISFAFVSSAAGGLLLLHSILKLRLLTPNASDEEVRMVSAILFLSPYIIMAIVLLILMPARNIGTQVYEQLTDKRSDLFGRVTACVCSGGVFIVTIILLIYGYLIQEKIWFIALCILIVGTVWVVVILGIAGLVRFFYNILQRLW